MNFSGIFTRVSSTGARRGRIAIGSVVVAAAASALIGAPAAQALETADRATGEVKHWASGKTFTSPYALVEVIHEGQRLERTAITRCRGQYADKEITVQIGTCGPRWRVRASYVSMNGKREHFRIVYAPRERPIG